MAFDGWDRLSVHGVSEVPKGEDAWDLSVDESRDEQIRASASLTDDRSGGDRKRMEDNRCPGTSERLEDAQLASDGKTRLVGLCVAEEPVANSDDGRSLEACMEERIASCTTCFSTESEGER